MKIIARRVVADGRYESGGNLGGDKDEYVGLSPFTTWTLSLRDSRKEGSENPGLDLSAVSEIVLRFSGRCRILN